MTTLAEIEMAVTRLPKKDFSIFADWFDSLRNQLWDREFEADVKNGLLDSLANEALSDFDSGKCKEL